MKVVLPLKQPHALAADYDDNAHRQNSAEDETASHALPQGLKPNSLDRQQD
jgi:hypothetical protein